MGKENNRVVVVQECGGDEFLRGLSRALVPLHEQFDSWWLGGKHFALGWELAKAIEEKSAHPGAVSALKGKHSYFARISEDYEEHGDEMEVVLRLKAAGLRWLSYLSDELMKEELNVPPHCGKVRLKKGVIIAHTKTAYVAVKNGKEPGDKDIAVAYLVDPPKKLIDHIVKVCNQMWNTMDYCVFERTPEYPIVYRPVSEALEKLLGLEGKWWRGTVHPAVVEMEE